MPANADHTPLTDTELAAMRERLRRVLEENLNPLTIVYEDSPRCLDEIDALRGKLAERERQLLELQTQWESQALKSREEAGKIRRTIKAPTDAEERCNVRAEVWEWCSAGLYRLRSTLSPPEHEGDTRCA